MKITHDLKIDLVRPEIVPPVAVVQGDTYTREIKIVLHANGEPWTLPNGHDIAMRYSKPDGTTGIYDTLPDGTTAWSSEGNTVSVTLCPQMLTCPGKVSAQVIICVGERILATFPFVVSVAPDPSAGAVKSENYCIWRKAFLPQTEGAKVGQYLQISKVDASGRTLEVVAVENPAGTVASDAAEALRISQEVAQEMKDYSPSGTRAIAEEAMRRANSRLVAPPSASVGQYFRVKEVDANGMVTAVEAVDAPSGGGGSGEDGYSPVATVTQTANGATVTITDKNGTTTATVANGKDGADGAPGEKGDKGDTGATGPAGAAGKDGKDYVLTASDKAEIVQAVLDELGGQPVRGVVDENNNIVISGSLADGTYTLKYENADGTYTEIGTFDVGKVGPAYTNLFDPASATLNQRWSNSNFAYKAENGIVVSDYIPITIPSDADNPSVLRWRGGSMTGNAGLIYFNSSKTVINASDASTNGAGLHSSDTSFTTDVNGDGMVYLGFKNGSLQSNWQTSAAYIRLSLYVGSSALTLDDIQNIIITIDEPIVD